MPGGDIFGFTSPTDIGDPCSWALAGELTAHAGKHDGRYFTATKKTQLGYTYSDRLAFAFSAFTTYAKWSDVAVAQEALAGAGDGVLVTSFSKTQFDGLSGEIMLRLLARAPGQPFAITVSAEPRWSRVDGLTGWRAEGYGAEFKLFIDVALTERVFAAMNFSYGLGTSKYDIANAPWVDASGTNLSGALTTQIFAAEKQFVEGVFLGVEGRWLAAFEGLHLDHKVGNALFAGPTLAIAFDGGRMLNLAWTPQVSGRANGIDIAPLSHDLHNFERHQFRIKFATPIGG